MRKCSQICFMRKIFSEIIKYKVQYVKKYNYFLIKQIGEVSVYE